MADKDWEGREMIFYFTGTGNSHAAAMQLQYRLGGRLINITDCMQKGSFSFEAGEDEPVGIVCPVYFGGLPSIVNDFLLNLEFFLFFNFIPISSYFSKVLNICKTKIILFKNNVFFCPR